MSIQHSAITDPNIHEPKGIVGATAGQVYTANGAGSGSWILPAYGSLYFDNIAAPYTLTYPAAFAKIAPTTIAGGANSAVTEGTNARLTFTGSGTPALDIIAYLSLSQATGADRDVRLAIYKNGVKLNGTTNILTLVSGKKYSVALSGVAVMSVNDYIEVYAQNDGASGDLSIYTFSLFLDPH